MGVGLFLAHRISPRGAALGPICSVMAAAVAFLRSRFTVGSNDAPSLSVRRMQIGRKRKSKRDGSGVSRGSAPGRPGSVLHLLVLCACPVSLRGFGGVDVWLCITAEEVQASHEAAVGLQPDDPLPARVTVVQVLEVRVWVQAVLADVSSHFVKGAVGEGHRTVSSHFALPVFRAA